MENAGFYENMNRNRAKYCKRFFFSCLAKFRNFAVLKISGHFVRIATDTEYSRDFKLKLNH